MGVILLSHPICGGSDLDLKVRLFGELNLTWAIVACARKAIFLFSLWQGCEPEPVMPSYGIGVWWVVCGSYPVEGSRLLCGRLPETGSGILFIILSSGLSDLTVVRFKSQRHHRRSKFWGCAPCGGSRKGRSPREGTCARAEGFFLFELARRYKVLM
jgi:hypothetical protein